MRQIFVINGGSSFDSYESYLKHLQSLVIDYDRLRYAQDWKPWLAQELLDCDVLLPTFPNKQNAQFEEWSIYFEKLVPFFDQQTQIVGHSLGATFLAKYLQTNPLRQNVRRLILVAGVYDDDSQEELGSFTIESADGLSKSADEIHLFHSKDDPVVPFTELAKFQADLPDAISHIFDDRLHFWQSEFQELLEVLKQK